MTEFPHKPFYFMRHGETDWNKKQIYMGRKDIPLNDTGRDQATQAYQYIKDEQIDHIVSSPLSRALETAEIVNKKLKLPIIILDELKECSFGIAEGKVKSDNQFSQKWLNGEHPDGAESGIEFEMRVLNGIKKALQLSNRTLIVSHGGVYAALSLAMVWPVINLNNCEPIFHSPPINQSEPWLICSLAERNRKEKS